MESLLLITPPFTQLNTPYPATAYLKGFLNTKDISAFQMDLGIEVILKLFSNTELEKVFDIAAENGWIQSENCQRIYTLREAYMRPLDEVIRFLQGKNLTFARQICSTDFLPRSSRFNQVDDLDWLFGNMGMQDKAKHLATLYLEDISDFIVECIDENFGFSRYAERLGFSANSFDELHDQLLSKPTFIDALSLDILEKRMKSVQPKMVCFSVPFPGNLYSAFRCAQYIKSHYPNVAVCMGGGFPNTELRSLTDKRVFEFFDYITLDDGEMPIELLASNVLNQESDNPDLGQFKRTFLLENDVVTYKNNTSKADYSQAFVGTPDYSDLLLHQYISVIEIANPMHSLWSDGRWNKLTMAHGCYWAKCTFCDVSLDYIRRYEPIAAKLLVDRMDEIIAQTGETGFHFVDEAAPPKLMKALALEIIHRKMSVTWWTNIRFEKNFTQDLCVLLKASGCIAVSGGLEVASDRLLKLIDKGVSVAQVAQVTRNFTEANVLVHSYLMYGYPTQTEQETIDSLEMVRQLFELGVLQSGFWHRFALTAHSPIGLNPEEFGVKPNLKEITFANNDVDFEDETGIDHEKFSYGLKKSLFNFMHDTGFDLDLKTWFKFKTPKTTISPNYIESCLAQSSQTEIKQSARIVWLGNMPLHHTSSKTKKGKSVRETSLLFHDNSGETEITMEKAQATWLMDMLEAGSPQNAKAKMYGALKTDFENKFHNFEMFWFSNAMEDIKPLGLLVL